MSMLDCPQDDTSETLVVGDGGMVGKRPSDAFVGENEDRGEVGVLPGDLDPRRPSLSPFLSKDSRLGKEKRRTNDLTLSLLPRRSRSGLGDNGLIVSVV